ASFSIYAINAPLNVTLFGVVPLSLLNSFTTADTVQDYLDGQVLSFVNSTAGGLGVVLGAYTNVNKSVGDLRNALAAEVPVSAASSRIEATGANGGNSATVTGATLKAGRNVDVSAKEVLDNALNTSFTFNVGIGPISVINSYQDHGVLVAGGSAVSTLDGGA